MQHFFLICLQYLCSMKNFYMASDHIAMIYCLLLPYFLRYFITCKHGCSMVLGGFCYSDAIEFTWCHANEPLVLQDSSVTNRIVLLFLKGSVCLMDCC